LTDANGLGPLRRWHTTCSLARDNEFLNLMQLVSLNADNVHYVK